MKNFSIESATTYFKQLLIDQQHRVEAISSDDDWVQYDQKSSITIGICWGDGIGEHISNQAERVLRHVLSNDKNRIIYTHIKGLTIENRAAHNAAIPEDVLLELKSCDVILKGPTTTPQKGDAWPNIESANVAMRRALDLFACVRPIHVPDKGIDWTFFEKIPKGPTCLGPKALI